MASAKPEPAQALAAREGKDSTFDTWIFRFWSWLSSALAGLNGATTGAVFYSDGAGGIDSEAAFTYTEGTNTLQVDTITGATVTLTGTATLAQLRILEPGGPSYNAIVSPSMAANVTYTLPAADGAANAPLSTNASGTLTWGSASWTDLTDSGATTLHKHDHGGQDGLSDDDHTQYVLNDGTRATTILAAASADYVRIGGGATASELRFLEPSGSGTNYTAFKAQAQGGNITYTLPAADATVAGYALKSDGAGTLTWGAASLMADGSGMAFAARHG